MRLQVKKNWKDGEEDRVGIVGREWRQDEGQEVRDKE